MENKIQLSDKASKPNLITALERGNKREVSGILNQFKEQNGAVNYNAVLSIPLTERLPALAKSDEKRITSVILCGITMFFEEINISRPMTPAQILDLSDAILASSKEDYLSLEDLILFLQGLTWGKYGPLYESMDIPKFMEKFEVYRQTRHVEYLRIKETQHLQFKGLGPSERSTQYDPLAEAAYNMAGRMNELKTKLKEQREINKRL